MTSPTIDFHCHLDLYSNPHQVADRVRRSGSYVLSVTTTPKAWRGTVKLAGGDDRIRTALGLHPQIAHERIGELPLFDAILPETRYIGEVGLDGSPECKSHWREQTRVFDHVLASSTRAGGRFISIHSRGAATEVLDALERYPDAGIPILHWFSGSKAELVRAIDMGCWFSVGPAMLRGKRGLELAAMMPMDRILTETDGPFASVGDTPISPADVNSVYPQLASCWKVQQSAVSNIVYSNFRNLLVATAHIPGPKF